MRKRTIIPVLMGVVALSAWLMLTASREEGNATVTAVFEVEGMTCGGCEAAVKLSVKKLDGIKKVEASYKEGTAVVQFDPSQVSAEEIEKAIEKLGYSAELKKQAEKN